MRSTRPSARTALAALAAALLFGTAGCGSGPAAGAAGETGLLNDLANRIDRAGDITYTAEYRVGTAGQAGDGGQVVIAQSPDPRRAAYIHPGGKAVFTESEVAICAGGSGGATRCALTPTPSPGTDPAIDLLVATESAGPAGGAGTGPDRPALINPATALRLVSAAVLDGGTVTRYEHSVAGEPATCVGLPGSDGFTVCITAHGLLGSFTGRIDGAPADVELTSFSTTADAALFTLPAGAAIDDRRPG